MSRTAYLAGTSFYDVKLFRERPEFPAGLKLSLEREPTNKYDSNATIVFLSSDELERVDYKTPESAAGIDRYKLGHIPAKDGTAAWLAPLLDAGKTVSAIFVSHTANGGICIELTEEPS